VFSEVIPVEPSFFTSIFCLKKQKTGRWISTVYRFGRAEAPKHELNQAQFLKAHAVVDKFLQVFIFLFQTFPNFLIENFYFTLMKKMQMLYTHNICLFEFLNFFWQHWFELRASHLLGRCSTTWATKPAPYYLFLCKDHQISTECQWYPRHTGKYCGNSAEQSLCLKGADILVENRDNK
jgi:hypothetical protein